MWLECQFLHTEVDGSNPGISIRNHNEYVVSLSKTLYPHCFSRLSCEMSTTWGHSREGVQCYELFGGIALKNTIFYSASVDYVVECIKL